MFDIRSVSEAGSVSVLMCIRGGLNVTFCLQSCMIMPDGSDKTLRVDGRFDVLHELNEV
jgi:hypothetical protein